MKGSGVDVRRVVTLTTLSVVLVLAFVMGLSTLSTPHDARGRLAQVQASLKAAQSSISRGVDPDISPNAICPDEATGAALGKARADWAAGLAKVDLAEAQFTPANEPAASTSLETLQVDITAKGAEAPLRTFLQALSARDPLILADRIDLNTNGTDVLLKLKGRLLCHAHRLI